MRRKSEKQPRAVLTFRASADEIAALDVIAQRRGVTRTQLIAEGIAVARRDAQRHAKKGKST